MGKPFGQSRKATSRLFSLKPNFSVTGHVLGGDFSLAEREAIRLGYGVHEPRIERHPGPNVNF